MQAYIYAADIYCEQCGEEIKKRIISEGKEPENPDDEHDYDSDEFPKGPYDDGGGEADIPYHCAGCGEFLANPLTAEGYAYVANAAKGDHSPSACVEMWCDYYEVDYPSKTEAEADWDKIESELDEIDLELDDDSDPELEREGFEGGDFHRT